MNAIGKVIADYEVAVSEYTTALDNAKAEAEKLNSPKGCKCGHCRTYLERLEGQVIPTTQGQIAQVRGSIALLRMQMEDQ
jgi:hypothetical protein